MASTASDSSSQTPSSPGPDLEAAHCAQVLDALRCRQPRMTGQQALDHLAVRRMAKLAQQPLALLQPMFFNDRIVPIAQSGLFCETARDPTLDILDEVVRQELAAGVISSSPGELEPVGSDSCCWQARLSRCRRRFGRRRHSAMVKRVAASSRDCEQ